MRYEGRLRAAVLALSLAACTPRVVLPVSDASTVDADAVSDVATAPDAPTVSDVVPSPDVVPTPDVVAAPDVVPTPDVSPVDVPTADASDTGAMTSSGFAGGFVGAAASGSAGAIQFRGVLSWHAGVRATAGGVTLEGWFQ